MISRLATSRLPVAKGVTREQTVRAPSPGPGKSVGQNQRGDRVVQDVVDGVVARLDANGQPVDTVQVACAQDPLTPGLVAVSDDGLRALVMSCQEMHGEASLVLVDFSNKSATTVRSFAGPGWVVGGFLGDKVVCLAQRLGDEPQLSLWLGDKCAWSAVGMQQPCVPARVSAEVLALVVCPKPDELTLTGPPSLCALDVTSGALAPLTPASGTRVLARPGELVVEGGLERVVVEI
ncbi:MAG: hypothetical protein A2138_17965 [Deltaproteobacteria bacterium RBG_16_71_12]|nr:MAG: hypothetical protein A2138_17965 [Deltaproteobacteria bacterium RBG_16_71_12]